ncbi:ornithine cyclodeaminase family protein [Streptacidiphilus albus]|uniref:ornithine cyclodeaminase family protein n=1 Tax=Streptacidiphilus albus TaxID=105425 RepID=UPI0005A6E0CB|nr:ornithine cyclodeaminase family protein [Streptacidiphilus albus]
MNTLLIAQDDIARIIGQVGRDALMRRMIERLSEGFTAVHRGTVQLSPLRDGFERPDPVPGIIEWMPHRVGGDSTTIKTVAYSPANPDRFGLPTIVGTVARYDDITGCLSVLCDGIVLTAIRTGAVSALASRALAHPDSRTVGMIGTGAQAVTQLHALSLTLPVERVLAWDTDPAHLASFAERVAFLGLDVRATTPEEIARQADVITTATSIEVGRGPVFQDTDVREHLHVNAIGADLVGKTELPRSLLERALVCPDHPLQALREGECQRLTHDQLGPSLAQLVADPASVADARGRLTVFDSTGIALEDHLALDVFVEFATELGLGTRVDLEYRPSNAIDPYSPHSGSARLVGQYTS